MAGHCLGASDMLSPSHLHGGGREGGGVWFETEKIVMEFFTS